MGWGGVEGRGYRSGRRTRRTDVVFWHRWWTGGSGGIRGVRWTDGTAGQRRGMYAGEVLSVSGQGLAMGVRARLLSLKLKLALAAEVKWGFERSRSRTGDWCRRCWRAGMEGEGR